MPVLGEQPRCLKCKTGFVLSFHKFRCLKQRIEGCLLLARDGKRCSVCNWMQGYLNLVSGACFKGNGDSSGFEKEVLDNIKVVDFKVNL